MLFIDNIDETEQLVSDKHKAFKEQPSFFLILKAFPPQSFKSGFKQNNRINALKLCQKDGSWRGGSRLDKERHLTATSSTIFRVQAVLMSCLDDGESLLPESLLPLYTAARLSFLKHESRFFPA